MGYDIFVSYSTKDKLFADALVNSLENNKVRCWYAPRDIPPGMTWSSAISAAIKQTPVMVLIFSASANSSQEVSRELTLASNNKCIVIPVRIENVVPSEELEYHLINRHWLDVYELELEAAMRQVMEVVQAYRHLFKQNGEGGAGAGLDASGGTNDGLGGLLARDLARRKRLKKLLPALLILLLAAGGAFWFMGGKSSGSVRPVKNAQVYVYSGARGLTLKTLRIESEEEPEHLLQVSGLEGSEFDNLVFRCTQTEKGEEWRFSIYIAGEKYIIFNLLYGSGVFFEPQSTRSYPVSYRSQDKGWAAVQSLLEAYEKQEKARQAAAK